jgi:hypothetical protein
LRVEEDHRIGPLQHEVQLALQRRKYPRRPLVIAAQIVSNADRAAMMFPIDRSAPLQIMAVNHPLDGSV